MHTSSQDSGVSLSTLGGAAPPVLYTRNNDVHLAYQTLGDGPRDVLFLPGSFIPISLAWDYEPYGAFLRRLAGLGRLIQFDRRGVGFSDPVVQGNAGSIDELTSDALAVLDAVGSTSAIVIAVSFPSMTALNLAHKHPERVTDLVLYSPIVKLVRTPDFPLGSSISEIMAGLDGVLSGDDQEATRPITDDTELETYLDRAGRIGASPASARSIYESFAHQDVLEILPEVSQRTLVTWRPEAGTIGDSQAAWVVEHMPDATYCEVAGTDYLPFVGDTEHLLREIESFVTGVSGAVATERVLRVMVFTDLVGSTEQAARIGDHEWRLLLDRHDELADEALRRYGGTKINPTGDGLLASFLTPSGALGFARDLCSALSAIGLSMRSGVHVGEVEARRDDVGGLGVNITARIAALAGPCEVLVSSVVPLMVEGTDFAFDEVGPTELRGVGFPITLHRLHIG